jgi:transposase
MVLYTRELAAAEREQLQKWLEGDDPDLRHRARVILLSTEGYRIPEIGEIVKAHPANLRKWIHRFNRSGCQGLISTRSGGAKPRFTEEQKKRIVALAQKRPRDLGLNFTKWTLHRLAEQAEKQQIVDRISHEYVRQILLAADCSYRQPRERTSS